MFNDLTLKDELLKTNHNDPLRSYFNASKILEIF